MMRRRRLAVVLGVAALLLADLVPSGISSAQVRDGHFRVGVMGSQPLAKVLTGNIAPVVDELQKLGYVEGKNIKFEVRSSEGETDRFSDIAAEFVALNLDVILAANTPAIIALKKTGTSIPIVFTMIGSDPVRLGIVESIPRPGGNFTGIISNNLEIAAKRMQMLKEIVPDATRIGMFLNPLNPASQLAVDETTRQAGPLGIEIIPIEVKRAEDIAPAIDRALQVQAQALITTDDLVTFANRQTVIELTRQKKLPTMYNYRIQALEGGLVSYGVDADAQFRRAAAYIDRILRGSKPADLPVEQASRLLLVINLKTAEAIGVEIPPMLVARARRSLIEASWRRDHVARRHPGHIADHGRRERPLRRRAHPQSRGADQPRRPVRAALRANGAADFVHDPAIALHPFSVAPAKAGVQGRRLKPLRPWVPACAGTTEDTDEQLAMVSVVQRGWAAKNPRATLQGADHRRGCAELADDRLPVPIIAVLPGN
jgi:putative ABC transport system substrate-binding protein